MKEPPGKEVSRVIKGGKKPSTAKYSLQVISVVEKRNAISLRENLRTAGFSPRIVKIQATLPRHKVYLGDFASAEEATDMGNRLKGEGLHPKVEMMEEGHYSLLVVSTFILNDAIDLAHDLQNKTYNPRIRSGPAQTSAYQVRVGPYSNRSQTADPIKRLSEMGYSPIIVKE